MASIKLTNCSVDLPVYGSSNRSIKGVMMSALTGGRVMPSSRSVRVVQSLRDVSLDLRPGDRLGLAGHNGAGKTTLLKTMAGIYEPTSGSIECTGTIANLLDVTMGMDFEATGLDNIRLKGLLHGVRPADIAAKTQDIVEFSGLGEYVAMPVRVYSSGMLLRLAFSIVTSFDADILLMDEWLGVGDAEFSARAQERLSDVVRNASILVLASHNPDVLRTHCNRIVTLDHGQIVGDTLLTTEQR